MKEVVLYHAGCTDGMGAAYSFWKEFGDTMEYIPVSHNRPPPEGLDGKVVFIVDFSYKRDVILSLGEKCKELTIIDHHASAERDLSDLNSINSKIEVHFDMTKSGAILAWEYVYGDRPPPGLLRYIQDRDLWAFKLHGTKEVIAGLRTLPEDFSIWDKYMDQDGVNKLMEQGISLVRQIDQLVEQTIKISKRYIAFEGYENVPLVNCPYMLASEVGNEISKDHLFSLSYYDAEDKRVFSMRTANDDIDLSEIAVKYGGGGHKKACGFAVSRQHPLACI